METQAQDLVGSVVKSIDIDASNDIVLLTLEDGRVFKIEHFQDCCETVQLFDANADVHLLVGKKLTDVTEEYTGCQSDASALKAQEDSCESYTWSIFKFQTDENTVILRWFGESNGYYSETVSLYEVK